MVVTLAHPSLVLSSLAIHTHTRTQQEGDDERYGGGGDDCRDYGHAFDAEDWLAVQLPTSLGGAQSPYDVVCPSQPYHHLQAAVQLCRPSRHHLGSLFVKGPRAETSQPTPSAHSHSLASDY